MLHLSPPTVTATLQRMEKAGIIVRQADRSDQRLTRVSLTEEGRQRAGTLSIVLAAYVGRTLDAMPPADRADLARLLDAMADRISGALQ
jgi:DNA-binding MarR family transcriptional regulator